MDKKIRKLRLSNKMTLAQLAALCDFEKSNMARIEKVIQIQPLKPYLKESKAK